MFKVQNWTHLRTWKLSRPFPKRSWHLRKQSEVTIMEKPSCWGSSLWSNGFVLKMLQSWIMKWSRLISLVKKFLAWVYHHPSFLCHSCCMFTLAVSQHLNWIGLCHLQCSFVSSREVKYKRKNIFQLKMRFWISDSYVEKMGMNNLVAELQSDTDLKLCGIASVNTVDVGHPSFKHFSGNESRKVWLQLPVKLMDDLGVKLWNIEEDGTVQTCDVFLCCISTQCFHD